MKKSFFLMLLFALVIFRLSAQVNKHRTAHSTRMQARPIYSGQTHTNSHGGSYPGSINSHHKEGHYLSPTFSRNYGIHKTKKKYKSF